MFTCNHILVSVASTLKLLSHAVYIFDPIIKHFKEHLVHVMYIFKWKLLLLHYAAPVFHKQNILGLENSKIMSWTIVRFEEFC